jgi:pyruvate/2-oxoglutarate dehydrogenase complex dihydrolipoamide acyltransferase (E2) component
MLMLLAEAGVSVKAITATTRTGRIEQASRIAFEAAENAAEINVKNKHLNIVGDPNWKKAGKFNTASAREAQTWIGGRTPFARSLRSRRTRTIPLRSW